MRVQSGQEVDEERIAVEVDLDEAPGFGQILVLIAAFPEPDDALKRIETINTRVGEDIFEMYLRYRYRYMRGYIFCIFTYFRYRYHRQKVAKNVS